VIVTPVPWTKLGVAVPVPPFATASVPVTPVDKGSPVAFVSVPLEGVPNTPPFTTGAPAEPTLTANAVGGVPRIGVTNVGEVDNTTLPEPVDVVTPVPPFATGRVPVTPVVNGSPVAFVNVAEVGVPKIGVTNVGEVDNTLLPEPVEVVTPVPPFATGRVPVTLDAKLTNVVEVVPVPPLAIANVPAKVTAPEVAKEGVKPVVPALNDETPAAIAPI